MARPLRIQYRDAYYHVTRRGNDRRSIYREDSDRELFLEKLKASLEIYGVVLHAYVLMGNHFHLLVQTPKANLSEFMRHFYIAYTGAYNRRHKRVGHLYQGRYKAILVEGYIYLLELSRYLHLNPIRIKPHKGKGFAEQRRVLEKYRWSSLRGYLKASERESWVNYDEVLGQVGGSRSRYRQFIDEGIEKGYDTPWENLKGQVVLGREEFVRKLKGKTNGKASSREQPSMKVLEAVSPDEVLNKVSRALGVKAEELVGKRPARRDYRGLVMEMMYRHGRMGQREIGRRIGGLDYSTVSRERKRLREKMAVDRELNSLVQKTERGLSESLSG
jgi:REP-associated tyrosine transposase